MDNEDLRDKVLNVMELGREIFVFSTVDDEGRPHMRYMATLDYEDDYSAFFLGCTMSSNKVRHIRHNPNVQLLFAAPDYLHVVTITGQASILDSIDKKRELWEKYPVLAGYLKAPDDPDFGIIRLEPEYADLLDFNNGFYAIRVPWDTPVPAEASGA